MTALTGGMTMLTAGAQTNLSSNTYIDQVVGIIGKDTKLSDLLKNDTTLGRDQLVELGKAEFDITNLIQVKGGAIYRQFAPYDD